jgi:hypothetical protein
MGKSGCPAFAWDERSLTRLLVRVAREQGRLLGKMEALGFNLRREAHLRTLTEERLFALHASLFPPGRSGMTKTRVGN